MARITICLVAIVLAAVLEVGLSGFIGHYRSWEHLRGNHIGFGAGKCSSLSGLLPDPKSGCRGRHAGANEGNGGDKENYTDHGNNADDENNDIDDGSNDIDDGNNEIDDGSNEVDDGNNNIDYSNEDTDSDRGDDSDYEDGTGNDFGWFGGFSAKSIVKQNASDIPPDGFITAGRRAGIHQYPWLVHLNIRVQRGMIGCGGSLISPRFVLTAAHCVNVNFRSYDDVSIFLAEYNTNTFPTDCVGNTCVTNVVMHPDKIIKHKGFEPNRLSNDIALMRLRGTAPNTEFIRPICLPSFNIDVPQNGGTPLSIAGWGSTGRAASPIKLTAEVKLVPHRQCQTYYRGLTPSHMCAASNNGQDTCQGDSGGPIMAELDGNVYVVGIVSGKAAETSCGSSFPTLYTNVFQFRKWIQDNMRV